MFCCIQALENFLWRGSDLMDSMEDMRDELNRDDYPGDVSAAKTAIETHNELRKKIVRGPVDEVDQMGLNIMQRYEFLGESCFSFLEIASWN